MNTEIQYNNLVRELDKSFPQFAAYLGDASESISSNVVIYFTFFSVYLKEHWGDADVHPRLAILLQRMEASTDEATRLTLHDFLLDLCSSCKEHDTDINLLMQQLPPGLQSLLCHINNNWLAAACQLPGGCC